MTCPSLLGAVCAVLAVRRGRGRDRNGAFVSLVLAPRGGCFSLPTLGFILRGESGYLMPYRRAGAAGTCSAGGAWLQVDGQPDGPSCRRFPRVQPLQLQQLWLHPEL